MKRNFHGSGVIAAAYGLLLTACSSEGVQGQTLAAPIDETIRARVEAFHQNVEFETIEFHDPGFAEFDRRDSPRRRTGARATVGLNWMSAQFELFHEDFMESDEGLGLGVGVSGRPLLQDFESAGRLVLVYEAAVYLAAVSDSRIRGQRGDLGYAEAALSVGVGLDVGPFRPSLGFVFRALEGNVDFDGEANDDPDDDDFEAEAFSSYIGFEYAPADRPWRVHLRGLSGEEQGAYIGAGWDF